MTALWRRRSDRVVTRLLLGFFLLSPLPLAGLAWLFIDAFERSLTETVLANLASIADKKADQINDYMDERLADGRQLARASLTHAALTDPNGVSGHLRHFYRDLYDKGDYHDILLIDLAGNVVFSILAEPDLGTNLNTGPWRDTHLAHAHRDAIALLETQTSPARPYAPSKNRPALFLVTPIIQEGRVLGSVALQLNLSRLSAVSSDVTGLGKTGETVLAQLQPDGREVLYVGPLRHVPEAAFRHRLPLDQVAAPMRAALSGEYGHGITRDYAGVAIAAAWRHLPALGWGMVVKMDVDEALAPVQALRQHTLSALTLLLLASGLAALWLGHGLVRPIQHLTAVTRRMAAGDLRQRAEPGGSREFVELAESFNQMANHIAEDQARLEERVHERTRALTESEATLRRAQAVAHIGSWKLDLHPGGSGLTWSAETYRLFGVPPGTPLTYDAFLAKVHPEDRARVDAAWQAALKGAHYEIDHRIVVDGEIRWVRERAELEFDADGQLTAGVGTVQDITDQVQAEAALRASEARLRSIFERANVGIAFGDAEGNIVACNAALAEMVGYPSADALIGVNFREITHPDDLPAELAYFAEIGSGAREEYRLEKRYVRRDGGITWVDLSVTILRGASGQPVNYVAIVVDISARKRSEIEYRAVLDTTMDGFWMTDLAGRFREVNAAYCELIGYSRDELLAMTIPDIEANERPEETRAHIEKILATGYDRFETRHRRKDGRILDVEVSVNFLEIEDGRMVVFVRDITRRKEAERALIEAKQAAEAANRAKSEFLANMSHEIRTPMNAILGLTQLVLDSGLPPRQENFLKKAHASARALLGILNDILDYSKIEAGRIDLEEAPVGIEELLRDVADLFSAQIEEKGLKLFIEIDPALPTRVLTDPLRLTQVLNNLVGNAVKFTDSGEIHIEAKPGERDGDRLALHFAVRDTGIGLSKAQADRLFQAFIQADGSITRRYGGTGLGLAICQRLVRLMGGDIGVSSQEGVGSVFSFHIRVRLPGDLAPTTGETQTLDQRQGTSARDTAAEREAPMRTDDLIFPGTRVLLVEDNPTNQLVAAEFLRRRKIEVALAQNGREALDAIEHAAFDLVLMDLHMPVMDGFEATRRLRERPDAPPVIAMTAAVMHEDRARCEQAGMVDFIAKPIEPVALLRTLRRWLPGHATRGAAPTSTQAGDFSIHLPGLEIEAALARLDGDRALYARLLHRFARDHADTIARIEAALERGEHADLAARLHALKGEAANLGARKLAECIGQMEAGLKAGDDPRSIRDTLTAVRAEFEIVRAGIERGLGAPAASAPTAIDPDALAELLDRLAGPLDRHELVPDEVLARVQSMAANEPEGGPFGRLLRQIDAFDYDGAKASIARLRALATPSAAEE